MILQETLKYSLRRKIVFRGISIENWRLVLRRVKYDSKLPCLQSSSSLKVFLCVNLAFISVLSYSSRFRRQKSSFARVFDRRIQSEIEAGTDFSGRHRVVLVATIPRHFQLGEVANEQEFDFQT